MEYFGWVWDVGVAEVLGAVKADKAAVNHELWAVGGPGDDKEQARETLRKYMHRWWMRRIRREAIRWLASDEAQAEYQVNLEAVLDCIRRCCRSTWWEWTDGSRLFFWRWPLAWRQEARDGARGYHIKYPRMCLRYPQVPITDPEIERLDLEKLEKLLRRRYIVVGEVRNTVPRFPVPKGNDDIRVVWDLARNGLNECMFTPSFFLPTMATYLRRVTAGTHCGDFDIGEQFHNYMLHIAEQIYCGVHIPQALVDKLQAEGIEVQTLMRWGRLVFGWQSSPYFALRMLARATEMAKSTPDDPESAFRWSRVYLNLPGGEGYDPGQPRVQKVTECGEMACELVIYFDDGRVIGPSEELVWKGTRQITSRLQFLGNQDAARKRGKITQCPNAWAGGVAFTDHGICRKTIVQEKWDKVKAFLAWVENAILNQTSIDRKTFRSGKGFLLHVVQTYDFAQPYLKGFHLAEEMWRPGRDSDGWKRQSPVEEMSQHSGGSQFFWDEMGSLEFPEEWDEDTYPDTIVPEHPIGSSVTRDFGTQKPPALITRFPPRLLDDIQVLKRFFSPKTPIQVLVRPVAGACYVAYGAGDASGEGFGSRIHPLGMEPLLRHGFWCTEESEQSSNWREMRNLLDALKEEVKKGRLTGRELWLATDNSTAATAYYKGSSSSRALHDMVTELHELTLQGSFTLHIFHIAGSLMIQIGIDGLSRGELHADALARTPVSAAPLHLSPIERYQALVPWLQGWLDPAMKIASADDWFYAAQQGGHRDTVDIFPETWVWNLAPAAAIHALEELGTGRLKRHEILRGIVIVPCLLQNEWYRRCQSAWCSECYESLAVVDFLIYRNKDEGGEELIAPGEEDDFRRARPGDHLFCPFECDNCAFFRLKGRLPDHTSHQDKLLCAYIRRANLDAFWSRRPGTVRGLSNLFLEQVETGEFFGFEMFPPMGPFPPDYESGMRAAIGLLRRSQRLGRHEETMKFSSARKARSVHTNVYQASARAAGSSLTFRSEKQRMVATTAATDSTWFHHFMNGFRARVGERRRQDAALSIQVMLQIQEMLDQEFQAATTAGDHGRRRHVAEHGAFYLFLYCASLRGFEGPKVQLASLRNQLVAPGSVRAELYTPHVVLTLTGRFKARSQAQRSIQLPMVYETASGLSPGLWAERLVEVLEACRVDSGWAFQDGLGNQLPMSHFEDRFYDLLLQIKGNSPELFPPEIDILEDFHLARSFRRGATTRATNAGVPASDIEWMNRWNVGVDQCVTDMRVLYSDRLQMLETYLRFSSSL